MGMRAGTEAPNRDPFDRAAENASEIQDAEQNQHEADGQFHAQAEARRDRELEQNDGRADGENRERVSQSPESADQSGVQHGAFAADDGGHGHDVIGIGGVPHPQKKSQQHDGEERGHRIRSIFSVVEGGKSSELSAGHIPQFLVRERHVGCGTREKSHHAAASRKQSWLRREHSAALFNSSFKAAQTSFQRMNPSANNPMHDM